MVYLSRMKRIFQGVTVLILACLMMGNRGCVTTDTIVVPEGPAAAQLSAEKDKQIAGLVAQVNAEQEARLLEQALASKAASSVKGVLKVRDYLPKGLPSDAIKAEGELALTRLPPDDPAETVKALERVVLIVTGQRDEAEKRYQEASKQTQLERAAKEAKDAENAKLALDIKTRDEKLAQLAKDAEAEKIAHADDMKKALAIKDAEIQRIKDENAAKERAWWINATRYSGLALILVGAIILGVFKLMGPGGGMIGAGLLVGLISIGIDTLTHQPWFPYLCGGVFLLVFGLGGYALYRLWVKHQLDDKKTAAIQDMIDEATAKGDTKAVEELKAHLAYRMGSKKSFWGKQQAGEVVKLGLVDPKGEEALKAAPVAPEAPKS